MFHDWGEKGLCCIGDLYIENQSAQFPLLQSKYHLPHTHSYHYFRVRHFVWECIPELTIRQTVTFFYDPLVSQPDSKHLTSCFVTAFIAPLNARHLREVWAKELVFKCQMTCEMKVWPIQRAALSVPNTDELNLSLTQTEVWQHTEQDI